jgi:hypothetical protein
MLDRLGSKRSRVVVVGLVCSVPLLACGGSGSSSSQGGSGGSAVAGDGGGLVAVGGSAPSGGTGGTGADCEKDRPFQNDAELSPDVLKTISGSNGTFTDQCDSSGNLTEYVCEGTQVCTNFPNPSCQPGPETGKVISQNFDCTGHCKDGACPSRCAEAGDLVRFESVGGASGRAITVANLTDGRRYSCEDPRGPPPDDTTCHATSLVGRDIAVIQSGTLCTGAFGGLTLDIKHNCGVPNCSDCAYGSCQVLY